MQVIILHKNLIRKNHHVISKTASYRNDSKVKTQKPFQNHGEMGKDPEESDVIESNHPAQKHLYHIYIKYIRRRGGSFFRGNWPPGKVSERSSRPTSDDIKLQSGPRQGLYNLIYIGKPLTPDFPTAGRINTI